uniref:Uncharacterized protein n=1 Tax=Lepeophtheirus salmonis TaxID=72036 RepID=A0A0K2TQZ1_LEPSM
MDVPECERKEIALLITPLRMMSEVYCVIFLRAFLLHSGTSIVPLSLTSRGLTTSMKDGTSVSFISFDTTTHQFGNAYRHIKGRIDSFHHPCSRSDWSTS